MPDQLTPELLFATAHLPHDERAKDGTRVRAGKLRAVLKALWLLSGHADYAAIGQAADCGRMTVVRALEVMERLELILEPEQTRERGKVAGKHYRINWTKLGETCRDEQLALFASSLAAAELRTVASSLRPVTVCRDDSLRTVPTSLNFPPDQETTLPTFSTSLHPQSTPHLASSELRTVAGSLNPVASELRTAADDEAELVARVAARRAELSVQPVGRLMQAKLDAALSPAARERRVDELVEIQIRRIWPDRNLMRAPCKRLARAIVSGEVKERDMLDALDGLDEKYRRGPLLNDRGEPIPRSSYWNGCIKILLHRGGVEPVKRQALPREPEEPP